MKVIWGQYLGRPECPYIRRWVLDLGWFSLRLHHWYASDDPRHRHNHPWWYLTVVLWGGYVDDYPSAVPGGGKDVLGWLSVRLRPSWWTHTVRVNPGGCWTLLLTGPERHQWGFYVNGKFRKRNKYFHEFGPHPCETTDAH